MKIIRCPTKEETTEMLRHVAIKGNSSVFPYKKAKIILGKVTISEIFPCQHHVYSTVLTRINEVSGKLYMREIFEKRDVGCIELMSNEGEKFIHMPPIIEQAYNNEGECYIVADGTHRIFSSILDGYIDLYCWIIENVDSQYPYYAKPIKGGWAGVKIYDTLPDNFIKRDYHPSHKSLYRDYNSIFTNIQPER